MGNKMSNVKQSIKLGHFKDSLQESNYLENEFDSMKKTAKPIILVLSVVLVIFLIPDILFNSNSKSISTIVLCRIGLFAYLIHLYFNISKIKTYKSYYKKITLSEFIFGIIYILIILQYDNPNFLLQLLSLILIMLCFNVVPNKQIYSVMVSLLTWVIFLILGTQQFSYIKPNELLAAIIFPLLFIATVVSYEVILNTERRARYIYNQQIKQLSIIDSLTKIHNRFKFDKELENHIKEYQNNKTMFSIIMFDIDDFKSINDSFGHLFGDTILVKLADLVNSKIRPIDIFARWGGEEFVIILPKSSLKETQELTQDIKECIVKGIIVDNKPLTCSFGVTSIRENDTMDSIIKRVDNLLYSAKSNGKNKVFFD